MNVSEKDLIYQQERSRDWQRDVERQERINRYREADPRANSAPNPRQWKQILVLMLTILKVHIR
jgi:hypothetical protein